MLTFLSAVLLPMTVITGLFGTNFTLGEYGAWEPFYPSLDSVATRERIGTVDLGARRSRTKRVIEVARFESLRSGYFEIKVISNRAPVKIDGVVQDILTTGTPIARRSRTTLSMSSTPSPFVSRKAWVSTQ